jgi:hypothetical protein
LTSAPNPRRAQDSRQPKTISRVQTQERELQKAHK